MTRGGAVAAASLVEDARALARSLTAEEWAAPSAADGWTVQDVYTHMAFFFNTIADPQVEMPDNPSGKAEVLNDLSVSERADWSPERTLQYYEEQASAALAALDALQAPKMAEATLVLADLGEYPVSLLADAVTFDHLVHLSSDLLAPHGPLERPPPVAMGAGSGFGTLVSQMLAAHGAKVVLSDVNEEAVTATASAIEADGGEREVLAVRADVTRQEDMVAAVAAAVDAFGTVDVLVNNAGIMPLAFFADHERAWKAWDLAIDVNIKGVVHGISAVYDLMMERGRGRVVNISSIYGNAGIVGSGVYSATKAAVSLLSDSLRSEAKGIIKVTTVKPTGVIGTNLGEGVVNDEAISGLVSTRFSEYAARTAEFVEGSLSPDLLDRDRTTLWNLPPEDLARAIVHVIDQPWGISISDITVRASGDDYMY